MPDATKTQIIEALRATGEQAVAALRALPAHAYDGGRYENGWTAREILAHIAAIEWTYARLIDVAIEGQSGGAKPEATPAGIRRTSPEESVGIATRTVRGGIDDYNARQVAKRADASVGDLIDELAKNRAATIAAVERADEGLLRTPIRSAGGITGELAQVIQAVAIDHVMSHVSDITGEPWNGVRW